jgi:hypothetical protein
MKYEVLNTLHPAYKDGRDTVFRNVGIQQSNAGEIPKRIHTSFLKLNFTVFTQQTNKQWLQIITKFKFR